MIQHGSRHQGGFQLLEGNFLELSPMELDIFLGKSGQGISYSSKIFDEPPVVTGKSQEGSNVGDVTGSRLLGYSCSFFRIRADATTAYPEAEIKDLFLEQLALFGFQLELGFPKAT